jgi:hypothetical protein
MILIPCHRRGTQLSYWDSTCPISSLISCGEAPQGAVLVVEAALLQLGSPAPMFKGVGKEWLPRLGVSN